MGLAARGRAVPRRATRRARMRGVCGRAAGPADDPERGGGDEQPYLRCKRGDKNAAGFCQGQPAALQISAPDKIHRRIAEDRHRQDRPPGGDEDVGSCAAAPPLPLAGEGWGGGASQISDVEIWIKISPTRRALASASTSPASGRGKIIPQAPFRHTARRGRYSNLPTSSRA